MTNFCVYLCILSESSDSSTAKGTVTVKFSVLSFVVGIGSASRDGTLFHLALSTPPRPTWHQLLSRPLQNDGGNGLDAESLQIRYPALV
jgi:hypothetical protein